MSYHDALHGERPPVAPVHAHKGRTLLFSEPVIYLRLDGQWCLARWTTDDSDDPIRGWFAIGGENPIVYVEGDVWTSLPECMQGGEASAEGRDG